MEETPLVAQNNISAKFMHLIEEVFGPHDPGRLVCGARYREGLDSLLSSAFVLDNSTKNGNILSCHE